MEETITVKVKWQDIIDASNNLPDDRDLCPQYVEMKAKPLFRGILVRGSKTKGRRVKVVGGIIKKI